MEPIKPIVFHVAPAQQPAPVAMPIRQPQSFSPWIMVLMMAAVLAFVLMRDARTPGPEPGPAPIPVVDVVPIVEAAQRKQATNNALVMDKIADGVESKSLKSWAEIQDYGQKNTAAGRAEAFAPVDALDTQSSAIMDGVIEGREKAVADYFRKKAEGHRRAAK
jgi:hypothetical protein